MARLTPTLLVTTLLAATVIAAAPAQADQQLDPIDRAAGMVGDPGAQALVAGHGLGLVDLTWEDTGRYGGSSVGPNISDMTIQVQRCADDRCSLHLMPVIRFPNFEDRTGDVPLDDLSVLVGNERGAELQRVSLREVLADLPSYLSEPGSWKGERRSLLAERDSHALVSAQAAFLPIAKGGTSEFNPVLFNYQSRPGDPAVLTLLATPEGLSATVIDNQRDGFKAGATWGQRLFFNQDGQRASLTGTRVSDLEGPADPSDPSDPGRGGTGAEPPAAGLNMVMLIQVPLKQRNPWTPAPSAAADGVAMATAESAKSLSDTEDAAIGHGELEGPFTEIDGLEIERDARFPIRVTVQFYKATSTGTLAAADVEQIRSQIDRVYDDADYVGSLVVDGAKGRPTEHDGPMAEPLGWWKGFLAHLEDDYGWGLGDVFGMWERLRP